jgi:hypothetical protein
MRGAQGGGDKGDFAHNRLVSNPGMLRAVSGFNLSPWTAKREGWIGETALHRSLSLFRRRHAGDDGERKRRFRAEAVGRGVECLRAGRQVDSP